MTLKSELYLKDILEAIERINSYTANISLRDLKRDRKTTDSILMNLLIIGEAVAQMPDDVKEKYSNVPWQDIKRFRNVVVHRYWSIDIKTLWDIVENQLEPLKELIKEIIKKENAHL